MTEASSRQPEVPREDSGCLEPLAPTHLDDVAAGGIGRVVYRACRAVRQRATLDLPPQVIHRVEFRRRPRQQPHFDAERRRQLTALFCRVRRAAVFEEDDAPPAPVRADHAQEGLMRLGHPLARYQQQRVAARDVEAAVQYVLLPVAGDGHRGLLAAPAVAAVEGRRLGDDRLVEHQEHGAGAALQPAFEPPFDCRQVLGRRASS